jgi:surfactin synthase thioesterase subunit
MAATTPWLVRSRRKRGELCLVLFPHAGVGISAFRGWDDELPDEIEGCYVQLPGREGRLREPKYESVGTLVPLVAEAIATYVDRPCAFFGHSMGGLLAFEVIRQLRANGSRPPVHLFVSATQAPQIGLQDFPVSDLGDLDLLREVDRRYNSVPAVLWEDPELRALLLPALRSDLRLMESYAYEPGEPLDSPITAFVGTADRMVDPRVVDPWRQLTRGNFRLELVDGPHLFLQTARAHIVAEISSELGRLRASIP